MQELINKIITEVGLSSEQATKTVTTVMDFVKTKLPPGLSANIESMFSGAKSEAHEVSYAEKATEFAGATKDKLEDMAEIAKDKLGDVAEQAEDFAKDALGKLKGMFGGDK
jgi:hypothetical protein